APGRGAARLETAEAVERLLAKRLRDPGAVVGDDHARAPAVALRRNPHVAAGRDVLDGIVEEVRDRLREEVRLAAEADGRGRPDLERDALVLRQRLVDLGGVPHHGRDVALGEAV